MKIGRNRMRGWVWTRQGWQKKPRRMRPVKSVPKPGRRRKRRLRRIRPAVPKPAIPVEAEAQLVAKERDRAESAPEAATLAPRSPRRAWSGKYDNLATPTEEEP
jgi:hypothetical protein